MNSFKGLQTVTLIILVLGLIAPAAAVSTAPTNQGSPSGFTETSSGIFNTLGDYASYFTGGFLAVTSTQDSSRGERKNQIVTNDYASIHLGDETCVAESGWWGYNPFSDQKRFSDATLFLHAFSSESDWEKFKNGNLDEEDYASTILVPTEDGTTFDAVEGKCYGFTVNKAYIPESLAFNGKGDYFVATDIRWENDNGELLDIKESSYDTGIIELIPPQEEQIHPTPKIRIKNLIENKEGEYPVVREGEEIQFEAQLREGEWEDVSEVEWTLSADDKADQYLGATIFRHTGRSFSKTFNIPGRIHARLDLEMATGSGSSTVTQYFVVREESAEEPDAKIRVSDTTVNTGETVTLYSESTDPDAEILHTSWSTGHINTDRIQTSFNKPGSYAISLEVTDTQGLKDETAVIINVEGQEIDPCERTNTCQPVEEEKEDDKPNFKPQIQNIQTPGSVTAGESFEVSVRATDSNEDDTLEYNWNNGESGESVQYSFEETGIQTIEVTVSDGESSVTDSSQIRVNPKDADGDGVSDTQEAEACINTPGERQNGCPYAPEPSTPSEPLSVALDQRVGTVIEASPFLMFLATTNTPDPVPSNEPVEQRLQVTSPTFQPDNNYQDGDFERAYATWAIIDDGNVTDRGEWTQVKPNGGTPAYTHEFSKKFDSNGHKAYYVQMVRVSGSYDYQTQSWGSYDTQTLSQDKYVFKVEGANQGGNTDTGTADDRSYSFFQGVSSSDTTLGLIAIIFLIIAVVGAIYNRRRE